MTTALTTGNEVGTFPFLFAYSFSHRRAEMEKREKLKLNADLKHSLEESLNALKSLSAHVVVDTCNRWEIYGVADSETALEDVWACICGKFPLPESELQSIVLEYRESQMVQHLFEVCSGIDSQMVGETEILGQVKQAFQDAEEAKRVDMVMHRVFSKAFQAAKWVRTNTTIGQGHVSIGNISVELASRIFGNLDACKVLLIGSGEVGRLTAQALKNRNAKSISFTSRTRLNAQSLAAEIGGDVFDFESLLDELPRFDIVISSTASTQIILEKAGIKQVMKRRSYRPLFLIDLAMPRDIESGVGKLPQVFLYNLDDVSSIANENLQNRNQEIDGCKKTLSSKSWVTWLEVVRRQRMKKIREADEKAP